MSATHIKTVMVKLDGYEATGSKGGVVVDVFDLLRTYLSGTDVNGDYACPSSLVACRENFARPYAERKTLQSESKLVQ